MKETPSMNTSDFFKISTPVDFFDFGRMPIANGFGPKDAEVNTFHMVADFFEELKLVKLREQPENIEMFNENYAFFTGTSQGMIAHFERTANQLAKRLSWNRNSTILEIGCNDGTFLKHVKRYSLNVRGIEPSKNVANAAQEKNIDIDVEFFGSDYSMLDFFTNQVDTIYAANVICHIPDVLDVMMTAKKVLKKRGYFVFEDPYLGSMLSAGTFDQIYDEHAYIFSVEAVQKLAMQCGLTLVDCEWLPTHGGSMRYYLQNSDEKANYRVEQWLEYEALLITPTTFSTFKDTCAFGKKLMQNAMRVFSEENLIVEGLGATSKSTTILNYYELDVNHISTIYDNSPGKIGKFTPKTNIPIKSDTSFGNVKPDILFLFAWNHEKEIRNKYYDKLSETKIITHLKKDFETLI